MNSDDDDAVCVCVVVVAADGCIQYTFNYVSWCMSVLFAYVCMLTAVPCCCTWWIKNLHLITEDDTWMWSLKMMIIEEDDHWWWWSLILMMIIDDWTCRALASCVQVMFREQSYCLRDTEKETKTEERNVCENKGNKRPQKGGIDDGSEMFSMQKELNSVTPSVGVARLSLPARDNTQAAHRLAITPDNSWLVVATSAGSLQVWDISNGAGSLLHTVYPDGPGEFLMGAVPAYLL